MIRSNGVGRRLKQCLSPGWLAQPAERVVHTDEVTGSSPVPPTERPYRTFSQIHRRAILFNNWGGSAFLFSSMWRVRPRGQKPLRNHSSGAKSCCRCLTWYYLLCCSRLFHSRVPKWYEVPHHPGQYDWKWNSACMESQTLVGMKRSRAGRPRS